MPRVSPFHSANETRKPPLVRIYHNDDTCPVGREILSVAHDMSGLGSTRSVR
jgi:hypothetical protein